MPAKPNEILLTRVYDAPVKLVWEVWTDLKHVAKWWGPRGFTITTKSKDLRPGGKWIYNMHGPDGTDYPNITTYHEVIKYQKLVYDHGANEKQDKLFTVTVTFREENGKTVLTIAMALPTAAEAKTMKEFIKRANGNSTWDRLAEYLETETTGKDPFIIHRSFDADIKTVFEMWTNPNAFTRWMGPVDSSMSFLNLNLKEGGGAQWTMSMADGQIKYGQLNYKTIRPPSLFIYTQNFCDKNGKLSKPPFAPNHPDMLLTTVNFVEEGPGATRVSVRWDVHGHVTDGERQVFHDLKSTMADGWNGSFDKLDALLKG